MVNDHLQTLLAVLVATIGDWQLPTDITGGVCGGGGM